jgi:hypothetical protein
MPSKNRERFRRGSPSARTSGKLTAFRAAHRFARIPTIRNGARYIVRVSNVSMIILADRPHILSLQERYSPQNRIFLRHDPRRTSGRPKPYAPPLRRQGAQGERHTWPKRKWFRQRDHSPATCGAGGFDRRITNSTATRSSTPMCRISTTYRITPRRSARSNSDRCSLTLPTRGLTGQQIMSSDGKEANRDFRCTSRIGVHLPFPTMTVLPSTKDQKRHHSLNEQPLCTS